MKDKLWDMLQELQKIQEDIETISKDCAGLAMRLHGAYAATDRTTDEILALRTSVRERG